MGFGHRLCLSYDLAFLALVRMALLGHSFEIQRSRCFMHPIKKRPIMKTNESLEFCAKLSAMLAYHNILDDVRDSRGIKKLAALCAVPFAAYYRRAAREYAPLEETLVQSLNILCALEEQRASADALADEFGKLLSNICAFGIEDEYKRRIAGAIGMHTGRFIYLSDAADDYERDKKSGAFNPFLEDSPECMSDEDRARIDTSLICEAAAISRAVALLDIEDELVRGIIDNVIRLGMPETAQKILAGSCKDKKVQKE